MSLSEDADTAEASAPDIVHWSPRQGAVIGRRWTRGDGALNAFSVGAVAVGSLAVGAVAVGSLAIGTLAVGRLVVGRARLREMRIDRLEVGDLAVIRRAGRPF